MNKSRAKLAAACSTALTAGIGLIGHSQSASADSVWNVSSGNFNVAANWNPNAVPNAATNTQVNFGICNITDTEATFDCNGGLVAGQSGLYNMNAPGSTLTVNSWFRYGTVSGATGAFNLVSGTLNTSTTQSGSEINIGETAGAVGYLNILGGTYNANNNELLAVARNGTGTLNISSGAFNNKTNIGYADIGLATGSVGVMNITGTGVYNSTTNNTPLNVSDQSGAKGTLNINTGGVMNLGTGATYVGKNANNGTVTTVGIVNLGNGTVGGTLFTGLVSGSGTTNASSTFNFNGGTLEPTVSSTTFMGGTALTRVNIENAGAIINTQAFNDTISQPLLHSNIAGDAAQDGGLTKLGSGTLTLSGVNTFTGLTNSNAGSILLTNALALGDSTLNYNGQGGTISFGTLTAATVGGITGTAPFSLTNATPAALALSVGNGGFNASYGGVLSGAGGITKIGTGQQIFTGSNTYTGATIINAGSLLGTGTNPYGPAGSAVTVNSGGALAINADADFTTQTSTYAVTFNGGALQFNSYSSALSFTTPSTLMPTSLVLGASPGTASSLTGNISGTGSLTFVGPGQLNLSSGNSYTGGTIITGGTLSIADDTSVNSISPTFNTSGVGLLQFQSPTSGLSFTAGNVNLSVPTGSTTTLTQPISGTAALYYAGPGKLILGAASTTSGAVNVSGGVLNFPGSLGTGNVFVANDATLQFATGNTTDITAGRTLLIGAGGMTIDTNGNNVTFNNTFGGVASGTNAYTDVGNFVKYGTGTLTDTAHIYATQFFVRGGTMVFTGSGSGPVLNSYTSLGFQPGDNATLTLDNGAYYPGAGNDFNVTDLGGTSAATVTTAVLNINTSTATGTLLTAAAFYVGKGSATAPFANGTVNMNGGALNISTAAIGQYGNGVFNLNGGVVTVTGSDSRIGNLAGSVGVLNITGGNWNDSGNIQPGYAGTGTVNQTAGTFNSTGGFLSIGRATGGFGYYNLSGGTLNVTGSPLIVGESGTGMLNVSGGTLNATQGIRIGNPDGLQGYGTIVQSAGTVTTPLVTIASGATASTPVTAQYQLNGGTLVTAGFSQPQQTSNIVSSVILNGGTLQMSANTSSGLFAGVGTVTVGTGGALINSNGFNGVIRTSLTGSAGDGGLTKSGTGTLALAATQGYTGATNITGGTLQLQSSALPVLSGLVAWYDTADTSTLVTSGSNVTGIINKGSAASPLNVTATATTGYATIGSMASNGKTTQNLNLAGTAAYNSSGVDPISGSASRTLFVVGSRGTATNTSNSAFFFNQGALTNNNAYGVSDEGSLNGNNVFGYTYANDVTFGAQSSQVPIIVDTSISATGTSVTGDLIVPSVSLTPVTTSKTIAANTTSTVVNLLGRSGGISYGTFDEALEYSGNLSSSQVAAVEAYLEYKWFGVGSAPTAASNILPVGSPVAISAGATLDLNGVNQTLVSLTGPTGSAVTLGTGTLTIANTTPGEFDGVISGAGGLNIAGTSTFTVGGLNTYTGDTNVSAGAQLNVASGAAIGTGGSLYDSGTVKFTAGTTGAITVRLKNNLVVGPNALLSFETASTHSNRTLVAANTLSIDPAGSFNLSNNDLDLNGSSSSLSTITQYVANGYNLVGGANWQGSGGIRSSTAAADTSHLMALGVIQNNQSGTPLFGLDSVGQVKFDGTNPGDNDILVKYTYFGDANLDGQVDGSDYTLIDNGYASQQPGFSGTVLSGWYNGDFNYDGAIDGSDYALIDNAYNNQGSPLTTPNALVASETAQVAGSASPAAVPEPASLGLLAVGAAALFGRRRRNA